MPEVKVRFSGELDGNKWSKGEWTRLPETVVNRLNPMTYKTRPLEATHKRPMKAEKKGLEVVQAGAWWQVWDGDEKLKSFRSEKEALEYAG